MRENNFDR